MSADERAVAAYLGLALGDALGATVEFMTPREIAATYGVHDEIRGGGWLRLRPGAVTDDTTMSLALGEAILAGDGTVDALRAAQAFDQWMRGKPVDVGNTVRHGILHFRQTGQPHVPPNPHAAGNGACMRVLPVAIATLGHCAAEVSQAVIAQAHVTHNHPLSDAGAVCLTRMVQRALYGEDKMALLHDEVWPLVQNFPEFRFRGPREENPSGYVVHTLRAVFQALFDTDTFEACLIEVVNRGGDADTTGAIAGMIAGALYGPEALPARWLRRLDAEIHRRCTEQARALFLRAPAARAG
ncbi:MAG: ADP-ribosyl-[dinitrogen reductase] hydrolase [Thiohalomonadaceae bacterium]